MSEANAIGATERIRDLIARPEAGGLERGDVEGIEPLDVACKFNRPAAHTSSAYQVHASFMVSTDDGATFRRMSALVAEGRTVATCLEVFHNWLADPHRLAVAREVLKAHELDALAKEALDAKKAETDAAAQRAKAYDSAWVDRKTDQLQRQFGMKDKKIQTP